MFSNQVVEIVSFLRSKKHLNQTSSGVLSFLNLDSLSHMLRLDEIEITKALSVKLFNWIEDIDVFFVEN